MKQSGAPLGELYSALQGAELEPGDAVLTTPSVALLVHEPISALKPGYTPAAGVFGTPTQLARNSFTSYFSKMYAAAAASETTDLFFLGSGLWDVNIEVATNEPPGNNAGTSGIGIAIGPAFTGLCNWWENSFVLAGGDPSYFRQTSIMRRVCLAQADEPLRFRLTINNSVGTQIFGVFLNWYCKKLR